MASNSFNSAARDIDIRLLRAARECDWTAVRREIESGADKNAQTKDGDTILHIAASRPDAEAVAYCLSIGVDMTLRDRAGATACDVAVWRGFRQFWDSDVASWMEHMEGLAPQYEKIAKMLGYIAPVPLPQNARDLAAMVDAQLALKEEIVLPAHPVFRHRRT